MHPVSCSALHTARAILKQYTLEVRPPESLPSGRMDKLTNEVGHVAVVIDYATNVFQLAKLRPEIKYWQRRLGSETAEAPGLANFLQKIVTVAEMIPKNTVQDVPISFSGDPAFSFLADSNPKNHQLSKAAKEVSRFIFYYYSVAPKSTSADEPHDRVTLARLADANLGLRKTMEVMPLVNAILHRLRAGKATLKDVSKAMREIGVYFRYLPSYENHEEEQKLIVA